MTKTAHRSNGFTLLEILMAISIFATVISLAYGSYRATFLIINTTEAQSEIYGNANIALDRMRSDLGSLYMGTSGLLQGEPQNFGNNEAVKLRFTSTAHLVLNRAEQATGYATITYTVDEDPDTKSLRLFRMDKTFRPTESEEKETSKGLLLCDNLQGVRVIYHSNDRGQQDNWDSQEIEKADSKARRLPDRIEISLLFINPDNEDSPFQFNTAVTFPGSEPIEEELP